MGLMQRMKNLFSRTDLDREIREEMEAHLVLRTDDNVAAGMDGRNARRSARLRFGNPAAMRERTAEVDIALYIESFCVDVRYACRQLARNPGFAIIACLMMALGMGASVAIFAFVDAALIQPLPYRDPTRLVSVYETTRMCPQCNVSRQNWQDWKKSDLPFTQLEVWGWGRFELSTPDGTQSAESARVSDGFFRALGVAPMLGRDFYAGEDQPGAPRTVLISYASWQKRFGGRSDVVGQTITLSGDAYSITGVLPREFHFAPRGEAEFWTPLNELNSCERRRGCHNLFGVARLKDGATAESASASLKTIAGQLERQYPDSNRGFGAVAIPLSESIVGEIRPILLMLLAGAALLLLIACVNVVSLLLVRSESRRQEIAVRGALGASAARLMRQFVTEGFVLVAVGSAFGLGSAYLAIQMLLKLVPAEKMDGMPYLLQLGIHEHVLAFAGIIAMLAALFFAMAPALRLAFPARGSDLRSDLAEAGRGSASKGWRRLGSKLVVVELATAVVLLVGAGLLGKSLQRLLHVELGVQPDHLAMVTVAIPKSYETDAQVMELERALESRVQSLPGVKSVGITSSMPVRAWDGGTYVIVPGRPQTGERTDVPERDVSAGYLPTVGARLLRGRYFTEQEDDSAKPSVVVINQTLAQQMFPGEDPIGKQLAYQQSGHRMQIIGEVEDIKEGQLDTPTRAAIYVPFNQDSSYVFNLVARSQQAEETLPPSLVAAVHEIDPLISTTNPTTMSRTIYDSNAAYQHRSSAWLVGSFAALALVLAVVGLYGVVAYSVSQRTREIGVRMALGAQRGSVYGMVLKESAWLTVMGIGLGLVASVVLATLMRSLLFGTQAWDPGTLAAVAAVLTAFALLASWIPAHRAATVNPVEALRAE